MWFRNKLRLYSKEGYITPEEIKKLTDYFKEHGCKNDYKSNIPLPIADRIIKKRGEIIVDSENRYDKREKGYELEEECHEFKRQGKINEAIALYTHMIDDLGFRSYRYFKELCISYRQINDLENELRIIDKYFDGNSTRTKVSNEWFNKRENEVMDLLGAKLEYNSERLDKLFNDDEYIKEFSENAKLFDEIELLKKRLNTIEENLSKFESKESILRLSEKLSYLKEENEKLKIDTAYLKQQVNDLKETIYFNESNIKTNLELTPENVIKDIPTKPKDENNSHNATDKNKNSKEIPKFNLEKDLNYDFKHENEINHTNNSSFELYINEDIEREIANCINYEYDKNLSLKANLIRKVILKEHSRL